jgi:hypothetical protein
VAGAVDTEDVAVCVAGFAGGVISVGVPGLAGWLVAAGAVLGAIGCSVTGVSVGAA